VLDTDINLRCFIVTNGSDIDSVWTNEGAAQARMQAINSSEKGEKLAFSVTPSTLNPATAE
jgi:hypothetical protein